MEATSVARPHGLRIPKPRRVLATLSDERLVERVRQGDGVAFEILYDRHHRGILAFSRHMLHSADEAEDAVQHAFIAAYNDLQRQASGREINFKPWLYTIARNRCLSILRARREQASDEVEISTDRLSDDVQNRADLQALLADIGELPDDQREALVLSEVGDLSHSDVAAIVGCEVAKVKSLVFQARTALIERRQARDMPCSEIREQLATLRGGALRRSHLRHHLASCPGCTHYREEIRRQRQMLALALPVVPSLGLRHSVLAAVGMSGGAAGGVGVAGGLGIAAKTGVAKLGIAALVAAAGTGSAVVATTGNLPIVGGGSSSSDGSGSAGASNGPGGGGSAAAVGQPGDTTSTHSVSGTSETHSRSAAGTEHGFTPTKGGSNGDAARQFAATRGKGKHLGLTKTHHTRTNVRPVKVRHRHMKVKVRRVRRHTPAPPARTTPRTETSPTSTTESQTTTTTTPTETTPSGGSGKGGGGSRGGSVVGSALP